MAINTKTTRPLTAWRCAYAVARAAAWTVSRFRPVVQHRLTDDECEREGLPFGSTEPAVHARHIVGVPWWLVDAWVERDDTPERCLHIDLLRHAVEVYFLRADHHAIEAPARH